MQSSGNLSAYKTKMTGVVVLFPVFTWILLFCGPGPGPGPNPTGRSNGWASGLQPGAYLPCRGGVTIGWDRKESAPSLRMAKVSREDEIKRKIMRLKRQGRLDKSQEETESPLSSYEDKVRSKLGATKSKMLGFGDSENGGENLARIQAEIDSSGQEDDISELDGPSGGARIGALPREDQKSNSQTSGFPPPSTGNAKRMTMDPSLFDAEEPGMSGSEMSEEELLELVAAKLAENSRQEIKLELVQTPAEPKRDTTSSPQKTMTGGVGGTWQKEDNSTRTDMYRPKSGSWGKYPRPKDISKAYGGGRRVGVGYSREDDVVADMNTKRLLKEYRRKVGIDVPTEKEHASEIEEALQISQLAMQRGVYATAVSALEKVTKWCSTNSKVGSQVFLELGMAYEATGRTEEAYQVYKTLTTCRMEDVKFNARRLLLGLEAIEFMKDVSADFSRQKVRTTFMDATGLGNIAQNFDDVYQTAYIDLDNGYYKRLTESVVRSNREARQILLKAKGKNEVPRMKIVQALRSIARHFDDVLEAEKLSQMKQEPTAYINGKPIVAEIKRRALGGAATALEEFVLASPELMMENLNGSWKLQLLADKSGDGVSFFNTTTAIQEFSTATMTFSATGPSGLAKVKCSGNLQMESGSRTLVRTNIRTEGAPGSFLGMFGSSKDSGFLAAVSRTQQIIIVDSALLITKSPLGSRKGKDADKEHFGVWRRC